MATVPVLKFRLHHLLFLCITCMVVLILYNSSLTAIFRRLASTHQLNFVFDNVTNGATFPFGCDERLFALVYVHTAPDHFVQRKVIRYTWGHPSVVSMLNMAVVFMLGNTSDDAVQKAIEHENATYNDLVQFSFLDSYKNLTYKAIQSIRWIWKYCYKAKFVVKTDDDLLINTFGLIRLLRANLEVQDKFICCRWIGMPILRDVKSKWYVSEEEMPGKVYPPYCSGSVYIYPMQLTGKLYNATLTTPFFWVDDVYATGLLGNKSGAGYIAINSMYKFSADVSNSKEIVDEKILFAHTFGHQGIAQRMIIWEEVLRKNVP